MVAAPIRLRLHGDCFWYAVPRDQHWDSCSMHGEIASPAEKRAWRTAVRKGGKARMRAITNAMEASWDDRDADMANWIDEAAEAFPGPDATVWMLFGLASNAIAELAELTSADRSAVLKRLLTSENAFVVQ